MKKEIDCQIFEDQLDALSRGALPEDATQQLRLHTGTCPNCAMLLRMHEHLLYPSLEELETEVPDVLVASMWPQVSAEIAHQQSRHPAGLTSRRRRSWLVPAAAAAGALLLIGSGFLLSEVKRLRDREGVLVQRIAERERWLAQLGPASPNAVARTAGFAGGRAWQRMLARAGSVTVSELSAMLAGLPPSATIFGPSTAERLLRRVPVLRTAAWERVLAGVRLEDGLQAGEALELIRAADLPSGQDILTARILELSRRSLRDGRS